MAISIHEITHFIDYQLGDYNDQPIEICGFGYDFESKAMGWYTHYTNDKRTRKGIYTDFNYVFVYIYSIDLLQ